MKLIPDAAPLPPSFTLATGLGAGLSRRRLRGSDFHRPTRGVRMHGPPADHHGRAEAYALVLPSNAAYSHITSCRLHRLPLSYAMEKDLRLHVLCPIEQAHVRREGVVGHRALHPRAITEVEGLRVVDLADTWVDLGELVGRGKPVGVDDLIVIGDTCATRLGSVAPLRRALAQRVRPRGKKALLEALESIRVGSWSPRETVCRIMFVRAGLPEPSLNEPIYASWDPESLLGYGDLVWRIELSSGRDIKVIGEYQGREFHSTEAQRAHDRRRADSFRRDGWLVIEIWDVDVNSTEARAATIRQFAKELQVDEGDLNFDEAEPRFFSRHAIDLALQRQAGREASC